MTLGLRGKVLASLAALIVLATGSMGVVVYVIGRQALRQVEMEKAGLLAVQVAATARLHQPGPGFPKAAAARRLAAALADPLRYEAVWVLDFVGDPIGGSGGGPEWPDRLGRLFAAEVRRAGAGAAVLTTDLGGENRPVLFVPWPEPRDPSGWVACVLRDSVLERSLFFSLGAIVVYATLDVLVILLFMTVFLNRSVLEPIYRLRRATEEMAGPALEPGALPPASSKDEIGDLQTAFEAAGVRLRRYHAELAAKIRELESTREHLVRSEKLASLGRLSAGLAHEIGNPLSAVLGYLSLLRQQMPPEEFSDIQNRIGADVARIAAIVRGLGQYARREPSGAAEVDLAELATATVELVTPQRPFRGIECTIESPTGAVAVVASFGQLQQVVVNLLINAADALAGTKEPRIRLLAVRLGPSDGERLPWGGNRPAAFGSGPVALLAVWNNGPPIPEEVRTAIFDPFFTTKEPGAGTGLGLAISHGLVAAHGGTLECHSTPEDGTVFYLLLPPAGRPAGGSSPSPG